jgi:hypothetical protein
LRGVRYFVPARTDALDPLHLLCSYLSSHDSLHHFHPLLWVHEDGSVPTCSWYISHLHQHFPFDIASHSLRSGGATAYALVGLSDDHIQALGHWSSDAFRIYIHKHPLLLHALIWGDHSVVASVH